jgi:ubiquinone/menaquinone biosynthesis C-methylase UbiE
MRPPRRVAQGRERMDEPGIDPAALESSLDDLALVNRVLGGTRAVLRALDRMLHGVAHADILDVGCGAADVPLAIVRWARRRNASVRIVAADLHEGTVAVARRRTRGTPGIDVTRADARRLPFADGAFDCALLSLTLHHFDDDEQVGVLRELARVSRRGVLVNELERSWPNYLGARLLAATLWRRSAVTRHDGPLSVLRAFTPAELESLARRAGLRRAIVGRHFFYRVVLVADGAPPARPGRRQR